MERHIHRTKYGTYHPNPDAVVAWTIHDSRGTIDGGPHCDECFACECEECEDTDCRCHIRESLDLTLHDIHEECIGLSFAFICLDGGDTLCEGCAEKEGVKIVECDCD